MSAIDRSRTTYNVASKLQRDSALNEEWQKLNGDIKDKKQIKDSMLQSKKAPFQEQQEKLLQMQSLMKTNKIKKINSINPIDSVNTIEIIDPMTDIEPTGIIDFQDAGRFDIKQDIAYFVRPQSLNQDYFKKETLTKIGNNIIQYLELADASDTLIKRAKSLLQEENTVKSVTDAYRNALIFS